MRAECVVPLDVYRQFPPHIAKPHRNDHGSDALGLQGADETFDDRDAPISADGPEARPDAAASAPTAESATIELRAAIGDQVPRGLADGTNGPAEERPHLFGGGRAEEDGESDGASGEMVERDGDPVAEGPDLREEVFTVLTLSKKNRVIDRHLVSLGLVDASLVSAGVVFRPAIADGAAAVILSHNHPLC